jgi:L-ascorbate metabolism protein UlaG (beta-lactamase superfamily)
VIEPQLSDETVLADVAGALARADRHLYLWWLGQSGFLFVVRGRTLVADPYLSDSLTAKYAATDKPHVRMSRRVVDPDRLDFIDVVTTSHRHTDHRDYETLNSMLSSKRQPMILAPAVDYTELQESLNITAWEIAPIDDGTTADVAGFTVTGVPAAHETIERDAQGRCLCLGYVIQRGAWTIYHSGDTVLYDGMVEKLRPFNIDVAILPINGRAPERRVAGNLNGREAAWLAKQIGAKLVIPCHYDMFEFNTADPYSEFVPECERLSQPYRVLKLGERWSSTELNHR